MWLPQQRGGDQWGGSRGGSVTMATEGVPSSLGLEMRLSLPLITCLVLRDLGTAYQKCLCNHLHVLPISCLVTK